MKRTVTALMGRGFDSALAERLAEQGHTLGSLQQRTLAQLSALGLTDRQAANLHAGTRPPIPPSTVAAVLFKSRFRCCVCRDGEQPVIIHHIREWAQSRDHDESNLTVLCLRHHSDAHTRGSLKQNLSQAVLAGLKLEWEREVKALDARSIVDALKQDGTQWAYINELRLYELAKDYGIAPSNMGHFEMARDARVVDRAGHPKPAPTSSSYKYEGPAIQVRYAFMKELLAAVVARLPINNLSDHLDKGFVLPSIVPGDFVFVQGAHTFSSLNGKQEGQGQHCRGRRSANGVEVAFSFDRWEATSCSSWCDWLVGTQRAGSLIHVKSVERRDRTLCIAGTVLGITSFTDQLKTRSYDDKLLAWKPNAYWYFEDDIDDEDVDELPDGDLDLGWP